MSVVSISNQYPGFLLLHPMVEKIVAEIAYNEKIKFHKVSFIVTDDRSLNILKKQYFNDDVLTDTISFNFNEMDQAIDGEIYISFDRILENATTFKTGFRNELALVVIHSLLHLIGYEDNTNSARQNMERIQNTYLDRLTIKRLFRSTIIKN